MGTRHDHRPRRAFGIQYWIRGGGMVEEQDLIWKRLSRTERSVVKKAAQAYADAWPLAGKMAARNPGRKQRFQGQTADDILEEHGISLDYRRDGVSWATVVAAVVMEGSREVNRRWQLGYQRLTPANVQEAIERYEGGEPYQRIADSMGVNRSSIYRAMRKAGVRMRGKNGR